MPKRPRMPLRLPRPSIKGLPSFLKASNQQDAWVDMRFHESHDEGGCDIPNNTITTLAPSYTTNARFVAFLVTFACPAQQVWLPGNDFQDSATWDAPPLCQLKSMHKGLYEAFKRSQVSPRRLPTPRTSSPIGPAPFRRNAVSRSSSPSNDPNSRPFALASSLASSLSWHTF
jgi:hypothetical protein